MTKAEQRELEAVWRERIADLRSSGMTVAAWALAHDVSEHRTYYWVRKFRAEQSPGPCTEARFVPVTVQEPQSEPTAALKVTVGAFALEVATGCDMDLLRRVVRTLVSA
jgi:transposase-like protein